MANVYMVPGRRADAQIWPHIIGVWGYKSSLEPKAIPSLEMPLDWKMPS